MVGDPCIARYGSDGQVRCVECRLVWDRNDPDPPECGRKALPVVEAPNMDTADAFSYMAEGLRPGQSNRRYLTKAEVLDRYWKWRGVPASVIDSRRRL